MMLYLWVRRFDLNDWKNIAFQLRFFTLLCWVGYGVSFKDITHQPAWQEKIAPIMVRYCLTNVRFPLTYLPYMLDAGTYIDVTNTDLMRFNTQLVFQLPLGGAFHSYSLSLIQLSTEVQRVTAAGVRIVS